MTPNEKNPSSKDDQPLKSTSKLSGLSLSPTQGCCFGPGDVVWAYVKGHPWWPAVVSEDENGGDDDTPWYQMKGNRYHVQYLGPLLEHQWISPLRLVMFQSKEQFVQLKLVDKKSVTNVCQRHREKWELAVKEAIDFLKSKNRVEMLNRKLVEAEQAKENIVKNHRDHKVEPKRDLRICVFDSTTYLLDEKGISKLMKDFEETKKADNQMNAKLKCAQRQLSPEDLRSCKSLNLSSDAVIDLRIDIESGKRETKSLTSSCGDNSLSELSSRRSRSTSPRKSTLSNIDSDVNACQHLLIDVEIVEALQSSRSKLKQVVISHLSRLQEQLKYYTHSPKSQIIENRKPRKIDSRNVLTLKEAASFLGGGGKSPIKRSLDKIQKQIEKQQLKEKSINTPAKDVAVPEPEPVIVEVVDPFKALYADPNAKDKICLKCEGDGKQMLACIECLNVYHVTCLPEEELVKIQPDVGFKCSDCIAGIKTCFSCKESLKEVSSDEVFQCTVSNCKKLYHVQCLDKYPALNENFSSPKKKRDKCPQHLCASCFPHDTAANKLCFIGKLTKCLKCPLAYHCGRAEKPDERCFPAGSAILSHNYIICPVHFSAPKSTPGLARKNGLSAKKKPQTLDHLNVNWCFFCGTGGDLILCELCPAAFHPKCVKLTGKPPDGKPWHCENCQAGLFPRFGDVVWVKCGAFRWWPAKICLPEEIPENIFRKQHKEGEFVVQFYGTKDFMWIAIGRVFSFEENDTASKGTDSTLNKQFQKGLVEATAAHRELTAQRERELIDRLNGSTNSRTPAPYKYVTRNIPQGTVKVYKADLDNYATCSCSSDDVDPCGPSSNCENRYTLIECHPKLCAAEDRCQNQRFAKAQYAETYYFKCGDRGWGLKNKHTIYPGQFVNEYCGDLIDYEEYERRLKRQNDRGELDFYFCVLDSKRVVDAKPKGCHSRFMNHSCEPNCDGQLWMVNGDYRVGLFAKHEIPPDTELTFNYNLSSLGIVDGTKKPCLCGAESCSGFIGDKPKLKGSTSSLQSGRESTKSSERKRKRQMLSKKRLVKLGEGVCYRCGLRESDSALIICSRGDCSKCYHLKCLKLEKNPGKWDCPKHFCDVCGKASSSFCQSCDNSFCKLHSSENIVEVNQVEVKCKDCFDSNSSCDEDSTSSSSIANKENFDLASDSEVAVSPFKKVKLTMKHFDSESENVPSSAENHRSSPRKKSDVKNREGTFKTQSLSTGTSKSPERVLRVKQEFPKNDAR